MNHLNPPPHRLASPHQRTSGPRHRGGKDEQRGVKRVGAENSVVAADQGKAPATRDHSRSTQREYPQVPKVA